MNMFDPGDLGSSFQAFGHAVSAFASDLAVGLESGKIIGR